MSACPGAELTPSLDSYEYGETIKTLWNTTKGV